MNGDEQLAIIIPALRDVAGRIRPEQLGSPTPCSDFSVAGVLGHMTGLGSAFAPMFRGQPPPDDGPAPPSGQELSRFDAAMRDLLEAVQSEGALDRTINTPGGPMPGNVFARLVAFDGLVHGWDLASSTGQIWPLPDDLVKNVDGFARQAITPQMRDGDAWDAEQHVGPEATPMSRLIAFSGRTVSAGQIVWRSVALSKVFGDGLLLRRPSRSRTSRRSWGPRSPRGPTPRNKVHHRRPHGVSVFAQADSEGRGARPTRPSAKLGGL